MEWKENNNNLLNEKIDFVSDDEIEKNKKNKDNIEN